tara:strand:+ start:600 stop:1031 length:432 start_codon:yes stop_codon:yes gene_type:complete
MKKIAADNNYRIFREKAHLMSKVAIAVPHLESEINPEIKEIGITKGEDGILTLSVEDAKTISSLLDKMTPILNQIIDQIYDHEHDIHGAEAADWGVEPGYSYPTLRPNVDPRLASLLEYIENSHEKLFQASMMANHLRDGTGG